MKKIALRFLQISVILLIFGAVVYYYAEFVFTSRFIGADIMSDGNEDWAARNEALNTQWAQYQIMLTIGKLLMICGVVSFMVAAVLTFKKKTVVQNPPTVR